jgi:hypothetical protein
MIIIIFVIFFRFQSCEMQLRTFTRLSQLQILLITLYVFPDETQAC